MRAWVGVGACMHLYIRICVCVRARCVVLHHAVYSCVRDSPAKRKNTNTHTPQHWDEGWRISYGGKGVFSVILMAAMLWLPESPRWLVAQDRDEEVRAWVDGWVGGWVDCIYIYLWGVGDWCMGRGLYDR